MSRFIWQRRFLTRCLGLSFFLATLVTSSANAQSVASEESTTFLVVRHAERDGDLDKLTKTGLQRAKILASLGSGLKVQAIYSTDTKRTKGTAEMLAKSIDSDIELYRRPTSEWLTSLKKKHAGQVVLIVGHSNTTGVIAGMLANEKPFKIEHDEYDALFVVQISGASSQCLRLQYGNSSKGASSADPDKMGEID
ncbi:MAG: phosphoglycerate mutase family protein [Planctomycetota bacterium]